MHVPWYDRSVAYTQGKCCVKHKNHYYSSCGKCNHEKNLQRYEPQMKERERRAQLYSQAVKQVDKHDDEKCTSCNKSISFDDWFCYCSLCPDCYLKSDEEVDNYLGETPPNPNPT